MKKTKLTFEIFKWFIELEEEIREIQETIFNPKYFDWNWYVYFEDLNIKVYNIYKNFDDYYNESEGSLIEVYFDIIHNDYKYFDFNLLTKEQLKEITQKNSDWSEVVFLRVSDQIKYPKWMRKFKNKEEVLKFVYSLNKK